MDATSHIGLPRQIVPPYFTFFCSSSCLRDRAPAHCSPKSAFLLDEVPWLPNLISRLRLRRPLPSGDSFLCTHTHTHRSTCAHGSVTDIGPCLPPSTDVDRPKTTPGHTRTGVTGQVRLTVCKGPTIAGPVRRRAIQSQLALFFLRWHIPHLMVMLLPLVFKETYQSIKVLHSLSN